MIGEVGTRMAQFQQQQPRVPHFTLKTSSSEEGDGDTKPIYSAFLKYGYKIGKTIGTGSYSKVKIAERLSPKDRREIGPQVACKIIDKSKASNEFANKFLPRELSIIRYLQHPNIVEAFEIFELGPAIFIFMEYCPKGDLLDYLKTNGPMQERDSFMYFSQIVSALSYLHGNGIAHRDLKCENILIDAHNQIKLSDFGFARCCADLRTGRRALSQTYCGSAAYAAPEILQGIPYNPFMYDTWALGCILYIMVCAKMPFDDRDTRQMLKVQLARKLSYPLEASNRISAMCKDLIAKLLEPTVENRLPLEMLPQTYWFRTAGARWRLEAAYPLLAPPAPISLRPNGI